MDNQAISNSAIPATASSAALARRTACASACIAAAISLVLLLATSAFAATTYTEGTFNYTVENGSITITNYYGNASEVDVPASIAGNPVNTIASNAFSGNSAVATINLPNSVTQVQEGAFRTGQVVVLNSNTTNPQAEEVTENPRVVVTDGGTNGGDTTSNATPIVLIAAGTEDQAIAAFAEAVFEETGITLNEDGTLAKSSSSGSADKIVLSDGTVVEKNQSQSASQGFPVIVVVIAIIVIAAAIIAFIVVKRKKGNSAKHARS